MIRQFLRFDWVLNIRKSDPFIIFLLIHPIYVIWIHKIGSQGEKLLGKKRNILFLITNSILFMSIFMYILKNQLAPIDSSLISYFENSDFDFMSLFVGIILFCWTYSSYYAMTIIIKLEEQKDEEYYPSIIDRIIRFFQLLYWIFGIWVLQPRINELFDEHKN